MTQLPDAARNNIESILRLEAEEQQEMTAAIHFADVIARFTGTLSFVGLQLVFVAAWALANSGTEPLGRPFDPFPFPLLSGILGLESVLLTALVLIRQTRMSRIADHRSHLDLQINLLSEQAVTKVIQMLDRMSTEMGIEGRVTDATTKELGKETIVEAVSQGLRTTRDKTPSS